MKSLVLISILSLLTLYSFAQLNESPITRPALNYKLDRSDSALGISPALIEQFKKKQDRPLSIALFGVDRRNDMVYGNADMIVIISLHTGTGQIKLSSILRDTYVPIPGHGMNKINAAFAIGGPQLAIRTLNENFSMDIRDFVSVDFFGSARVIDALGGLTIDLKKEEIPALNTYLQEISPAELLSSDKLDNYGPQKLNGRQAVAYTRIRAVGNNDYQRTARQRMVMTSLIEKVKGIEKATLQAIAMKVMPYMETSFSGMSLLSLSSEIFNSETPMIKSAMFPLTKESKGITVDGIWYLSTDLKASTASLHRFINND